ncbi:MAG: glycosyltransferase family 2 protein [Woeseiaceae bacterium]
MSKIDDVPAVVFATIRPESRPIDNELTLLIPTLGRPLICDCLRSIVAGSLWPGQIIVVDQGPMEEIPMWLDEIATLGIRTRYRRSAETGRSRALNQGLELVDSRYVLITDDDCLVDESWTRNLAQHLRSFLAGVFTGRITAAGEQPILGTVLSEKAGVARKPGLLFDRLSGGNLGAAMDVFHLVGLFDEDPCVAFAEDGEWAYRALRYNVTIAFVPDVIVKHRGWRAPDEREHQYAEYARSHAAFFGKYLRRGDAFIAIRALLHFGRAIRRWLVGVTRGERDLAANGRAYATYFVPGLISGLRSKLSPPSLAQHRPGPNRHSGLRIAVIILTINQRQQTMRCLELLLRQHEEGTDFAVFVWDNGSTDGTAAAVSIEYPDVIIRTGGTNLGVAGGRNAAATAAIAELEPDLLLFLDNDMVVEPGFVVELARPFASDTHDVIGQTQAKLRLADSPELLNDGGGFRLQFWLGRTRPVGFGELDAGQFDQASKCTSCGGAMMVRTDVFRRLGGFDEAFNPFGPEDLDFSLRLQRAGFEAWYVPQAIAYHDVNHTFGEGDYSEDYAKYRARHWLQLMRRHAGIVDWIGFLFIGVPVIALRVLFREGLKGNLAALRGLILGAVGRR